MPEVQPTAGVDFFDLRRSPMKLVEVVDHESFKWNSGENGTIVNISGGNGKIYGPYRLDREFARGNGKIVFVAYSLGTNAKSKPMTKDELIQQNAELLARLQRLEAK